MITPTKINDTFINKQPVGFLWKISYSAEKIGYIYGTIHSVPPSLCEFNPSIRQALSESKVVTVELRREDDPTGICPLTKIKLQIEEVNKLSPEQRKNLHSFLLSYLKEEKMLTPELEKEQELHFILITLALLRAKIESVNDLTACLDNEIRALADAEKKQTISLESLDDHILSLPSTIIPVDDLIKVADSSNENNLKGLRSIFQKYIDQNTIDLKAYKEGNISPLSVPSVNSKDMKKRNFKMADKIDTLIQNSQKPFSVIGCSHMVGEYSIIKILAEYGCKVEQVRA